jgi:hypothetical protein
LTITLVFMIANEFPLPRYQINFLTIVRPPRTNWS